MKKDSIIDCLSCILFRVAAPLIRGLPLPFALYLGRILGELFYCFDVKHRAIAYTNIKTAFADSFGPLELKKITKDFYRNFGQNLTEIFLIPRMDKEYFSKYIRCEGLQHIRDGFKKGKGVIFLAMHGGSWELSNIICVYLGFPFSLFVRDQRLPRLNELLNSYRSQKGCKIIKTQNETRQLVQALKDNSAIGITADQGGRAGTLVKFFGKSASMSSGAIRMSLKYGAALIPVFYTRISGPYLKVIIEPPFQIKRGAGPEADIRNNLQEVMHIFERNIRKYSCEYLWSYKVWKYTDEKRILILSDGKTGHLRQAEAVAKIAGSSLGEKGIINNVDTVEIKFKNRFSRPALAFGCCLRSRYSCQGCLRCLKAFLKAETYHALIRIKPDIIISCGSSLAAVNFVLARENLAKSIVIMRPPPLLGINSFDLVIMPRHDMPPKRKNVAITEGALNLIDEAYLKKQSNRLLELSAIRYPLSAICIGLLIGGDTKDFHLKQDTMEEVVRQIKSICEKHKADILITTSRRTPKEVEDLLKMELRDYPACKLLIIANEKNLPEAIGGILGLSSVLVISPESISMISEAATSNRHVLTFSHQGLKRRHRVFLDYLAEKKYIYLTEADNLGRSIDNILRDTPAINALKDNVLVSEAINRIL